ncbi:MAG: hypothetical protein AAF404_00555 [Pseudomonadota bacterium]
MKQSFCIFALLVAAMTLPVGCGFKSDLFLPDDAPSNDPEAALQAPLQLPPLPAAQEPEVPGVAVEIPSLDDETKKKKTNQ